MNEILGAIGSGFLRPLATLVLPGAFAVTPAFLCMRKLFPEFSEMCSANATETVLALSAVSLFIGFVLEAVGADIENHLDAKMQPQHEKQWYEYLRRTMEPEPVGHRYLKTVLLWLKFELSMLAAIPIAAVGVAALYLLHTGGRICHPDQRIMWVFLLLLVVLTILALCFWRWAKAGHLLLSRLRTKLLKPMDVTP